MHTRKRASAHHTWKVKHNNIEMLQLFASVHTIDDSIFRLEANGDLAGELEFFRLQKTRMRDHIYRMLRIG